jgi:hypothetical protein
MGCSETWRFASLELNPIVLVSALDEEAVGQPDYTRRAPYFSGRSPGIGMRSRVI